MDINYMIIDGVVADYVQEIAAFIDQVNGKTLEDEDSFEKYTSSIMESSNEEDANKVFKAIADKSVSISKAPERHFEAMYNLVLLTLTFSPQANELLTIVIKNLISNPPDFPHASSAVLFVLTNAFNNLPRTSGFRYNVLDTILDYAVDTKNENLVRSQLTNLIQWTSEWEDVSDEKKSDILYKATHLFDSWDGNRENYYKCLSKSVELISSEKANASENQEKISALLQYVISTYDFFDFESVVSLPAVQAASGNTEISKLLEFIDYIGKGDYKAVDAAYLENVPSNLSKVFAASADKPKKAALAKVIGGWNSRVISYDAIAQGVDVDVTKVESIIIDTIKAGLIEGRLSQSTKEFDIHRASSVGVFGQQDWKKVQDKLELWKDSLKDILVVVQGARDNLKKTA